MLIDSTLLKIILFCAYVQEGKVNGKWKGTKESGNQAKLKMHPVNEMTVSWSFGQIFFFFFSLTL
jgi:hypothetical protein